MIETKRLILRPWKPDDAEALYKYARESKVSKPANWPQHTSVDMSKWVIKNIFIPNPHTFAIVLKETTEPIGAIGLIPTGEENYVVKRNEREVGYWIGLPYWNKGLASEALIAFEYYCNNCLKLDSLLITTGGTNIASQRVAEKCGFDLVGTINYNDSPSKVYRIEL